MKSRFLHTRKSKVNIVCLALVALAYLIYDKKPFHSNRMDEFRYTYSRQLHKQSPMQILSPDQVSEMVPILKMDNIHGGLFTPNEGHIDPYSLTMAIAKGARQRGARMEQNCQVTGLEHRNDAGWDVVTRCLLKVRF